MYTHSNPIPHRSHKKSSAGCKACKTRKVKCDEKRPVCGKCLIHFSNIKTCDWGPVKSCKPISSDVSSKRIESLSSHGRVNHRRDIDVPPVNDVHSKEKSPLLPHSGCIKASSEISISQCPKCGCPCHNPDYTSIMLDPVFGACRVCGNLPSLSHMAGYYCAPVVPPSILLAGEINAFSTLPAKESPRVNALIYHWVKTLALWETSLKTAYCTNPTWLATAIAHPALFNATLYVSSVHISGLHGQVKSPESLYYKAETIRWLNTALQDPIQAVADETIAAVMLLTNAISVIGDSAEVDAHTKGLQEMVKLRGGIENLIVDGVLLHMLCTTNHLTAVLSESPHLIPASGIPYTPSRSTSPCQSDNSPLSSPFLIPFAISLGFHHIIADNLHQLGFLSAVIDVFTSRFLPSFRKPFVELIASIDSSSSMNGSIDDRAQCFEDFRNEGPGSTQIWERKRAMAGRRL